MQVIKNNIEYISKKLNLEFVSQIDDNLKGRYIYNIGDEKALNNWNKNKDYYNRFYIIITSDTAPISRVILQNNYQKN